MNSLRNRRAFLLIAIMITGALPLGCKNDTAKPSAPPATPTVPAPGTPPEPKASAARASDDGGSPVARDAAAKTAGEAIHSTAATSKAVAERWMGEHVSVALPDGWIAYDGEPPRLGTFMTGSGLQIAAMIFNGDGGGTLGNVNLWRRQVGLKPGGQREMNDTNQRIESSGGPFTLIDLQGSTQRMLAAVLPQSDRTVFLKMTGPFATVEQEKESFVELAKSLKVE